MKNKKNIVVFDLDGTLSIVGDRLKYLESDPIDWDSFYEHCGEDAINAPIVFIFHQLYYSSTHNMPYRIKIVTGRRESVRDKTIQWLHAKNIIVSSVDVHMRKTGDTRHDTTVKPELIEEFKDQILMIFEDRKSMVDKWRELGYTCLQVAPGDF